MTSSCVIARPSNISIQPHFALIALLPNESHFSSNDSSFSGVGSCPSWPLCAGPGVCALIALLATTGAANNTIVLKHVENVHMLTDSPNSGRFSS